MSAGPQQNGSAPDPGDRRDSAQGPPGTGRSVFRQAGQFQSDLAATSIISYLITGPALYGGLGWLGDRFFGTSFLLPVGIVGGMALSIYLIWFRYGRT